MTDVVSGLRVLVVDDYDDMRRSLCTLLELWGHETCAAADGPEALRLVRDFCPDVVLLDLMLPGMGGYEVARRLRQRDTEPLPWLVALTGRPSPCTLPDAIEADFDQYLSKPFDPQRLDCLLHSYALARQEQPESDATNPFPQPPPRNGEGEKDRLAPPRRFGEGAGGRGWSGSP